MGNLLGFGITDYPATQMTDLKMSRSLQNALSSERISDSMRHPNSWPAEMQSEWGTDMGKTTAKVAREASIGQIRLVRKTIDKFNPDVVIILSKDHCETTGNRDDPESSGMYVPYWICAFDEVTVKPYQPGNGLGVSPNTEVLIPGAREFGLRLANGLRAEGMSPTVFNRPTAPEGLAHTYRSTFVLMDWDERKSTFPHRVLPLPFNPFGSRGRDVTGLEPLQPRHWLPPTMPEAFALGRSIARVVLASDQRVALGVSAGWSHANNTSWDRSWLSPDVEADRQLFEHWKAGKFDRLAEMGPEELEEHGWWELWGWGVLAGAMIEAGAGIVHANLQTDWIFNSNWVTTIFEER